MEEVKAKCPSCGEEILIDKKSDAEICPNCKKAFVSEKAINLYNSTTEELNKNANDDSQLKKEKAKHFWKWFGKTLLFILECFVYLIYTVSFVWLFVDFLGIIKSKKK